MRRVQTETGKRDKEEMSVGRGPFLPLFGGALRCFFRTRCHSNASFFPFPSSFFEVWPWTSSYRGFGASGALRWSLCSCWTPRFGKNLHDWPSRDRGRDIVVIVRVTSTDSTLCNGGSFAGESVEWGADAVTVLGLDKSSACCRPEPLTVRFRLGH